MSIETNKTNLEAGSFKALKNVADAARQVMLGEDQEKQELQELINIIGSAKYISEEQKEVMISVLEGVWEDKEKEREQQKKEVIRKAEKEKVEREKEKKKKEREKSSAEKERDDDAEVAARTKAATGGDSDSSRASVGGGKSNGYKRTYQA